MAGFNPEDFHQHNQHPHVVQNNFKMKEERRPPRMLFTFLFFAIILPVLLPFAFSIANWVSTKVKAPPQIAMEIGEDRFASGVWGGCVGLIVVGLLAIFKACRRIL